MRTLAVIGLLMSTALALAPTAQAYQCVTYDQDPLENPFTPIHVYPNDCDDWAVAYAFYTVEFSIWAVNCVIDDIQNQPCPPAP